MMKLGKSRFPVVIALLLLASPVHADKRSIVVVTAATNKLGSLTEAQARDYFLGNEEFLASGGVAQPVDQAKSAPITAAFYAAVANMSLKELSVHWAKKIFTGRGTPPQEIDGGDAKVKEYLKTKTTAIGYIYSDAVDGSVKVLLNVTH